MTKNKEEDIGLVVATKKEALLLEVKAETETRILKEEVGLELDKTALELINKMIAEEQSDN